MAFVLSHGRDAPDPPRPPFRPLILLQPLAVVLCDSGLPEHVDMLELVHGPVTVRVPARIGPTRVFAPDSLVVQIEAGRLGPLGDHAASQQDLGGYQMLSAAHVVALQPALNGLFAALKDRTQLPPVSVWMLAFGFQDLFQRYRIRLAPDVVRLELRYAWIGKAQYVADVDGEKTSGLDDAGMTAYHVTQKTLPLVKCDAPFVGLTHAIRWRPKTQINAVFF